MSTIRIVDLLKTDTIITNLSATSKEEVLDELVQKLDQAGRLNDKALMKEAIWQRESLGSTGIGEGIAIPHAKTAAVKTSSIAFGLSKNGVEFNSLDGQKAHLFFMIAATENANQAHLETLALLSQMLMDDNLRDQLRKVENSEQVLAILSKAEQALLAESASNEQQKPAVKGNVVAVTACPTGIAHTYMAADSLKKKAAELGINLKVETNGSGGVKNELTSDDIQNATAVIVAADKQVEMERFAGKVVIEVPVVEGIRNAEELLTRAVKQDGPVYKAASYQDKINSAKQEKKSKQPAFYKHLMNGVSNMLPFVVGGGIIIAISFMFGIKAFDPNDPSFNPIAKMLMDIGGGNAFKLMIPVLAGFIAMSIGDRPAFAPGMVAGFIAANSGAGFLGGLIGGFLAGYIIIGLKKVFAGMPASLEGLKPMLLYPLLGILITGFIMLNVISDPVAAANAALGDWLKNMGSGNAIFLGIILGAMMAFDMGGPVNKAAFTFGIAMIAEGNFLPHAAIMAAGMTPPLGLALATTLFPKKFSREERDAGKTAYVLGASFITEGAIPFAAADPTRVIPSIMIGSAVAGGLSMAFGCTLPAPHGGLFVLPVVGNIGGYLVAIAAGTIVTAILVNILKKEQIQ